jgi:hypothetical protein
VTLRQKRLQFHAEGHRSRHHIIAYRKYGQHPVWSAWPKTRQRPGVICVVTKPEWHLRHLRTAAKRGTDTGDDARHKRQRTVTHSFQFGSWCSCQAAQALRRSDSKGMEADRRISRHRRSHCLSTSSFRSSSRRRCCTCGRVQSKTSSPHAGIPLGRHRMCHRTILGGAFPSQKPGQREMGKETSNPSLRTASVYVAISGKAPFNALERGGGAARPHEEFALYDRSRERSMRRHGQRLVSNHDRRSFT